MMAEKLIFQSKEQIFFGFKALLPIVLSIALSIALSIVLPIL